MNNKKFLSKLLLLFVGSLSSAFAQLDGPQFPDLSEVEIPVFDGVPLAGEISAVSFDLTMAQGLTSPKLTGNGTISAAGFDVYQDEALVIDFDGDVIFSASATKTGSIVRLTGAKTTIDPLSVSGSGTLYNSETEQYEDVTVSSVKGAFAFKSLHVDLDNGTIGGGVDKIAAGTLKISGYVTELGASSRGTVSAKYGTEDFPELDFPAENIIYPEITLDDLITTSKGVVTGTAVGTFGGYDDVSFSVKGRRSLKTGISTLTLTGTGSGKGVNATLNLDDDGQIYGTKNALTVLGYKLKF
jgi:hypothetical protein